ncbi:MAG TPA: hypothetical protein VFG86_11425 [Chloroflexota bacterium]|jgi:hypothetical protein|nr:hypothetical protein [Chloroflexota bacterium]
MGEILPSNVDDPDFKPGGVAEPFNNFAEDASGSGELFAVDFLHALVWALEVLARRWLRMP